MRRFLLVSLAVVSAARAQTPTDDQGNAMPPPQQPRGYPPQSYPAPQYQYPQQYPYPQQPYPQYRDQYGRPIQPQPYATQPYGGQYQYRDAYGRPIQPPQQQQPQYPQQNPYRDPYGRPYPQQPAPQYQQMPPPAPAYAPPPLAVLTLTTSNDAARADALACVDALEHYHLAVARQKCGDALAKDPDLALAHLWMAQAAATPAVAAAELQRAAELARKASPGEQLLVAAHRAWKDGRLPDAKRAYDELAAGYGGEKRVFLARGLFRQEALGDLDGAIADYRRAAELDEKYAAAYNFLGFALADQDKHEEAAAALRKYAAIAPSEPNAHDSLAALALRSGDFAEALAEEKKALTIDPSFLVAHATMGDALLLQGKPKDARREYAFLEGADDAALRHDGAMRAARTFLFEEKSIDAEKALIKEGDLSRKASRPADAAEAFLDAARIQIERGALAEAGRGVKEATESLKPATEIKDAASVPLVDESDRRRLAVELAETRAMLLASAYERETAEARADEMRAALEAASDPHALARARELKGWIAWRVGDDAAAIAALDKATAPRMRLALALAVARSGDGARAKVIFDELSRRAANDLDTALTRPRAAAWLRGNAGGK